MTGEARILGREGDTKITWDSDNADEVATARETFNKLRDKRYLAFRMTGSSERRGEQMDHFDPNAEKMILVPPMAGG